MCTRTLTWARCRAVRAGFRAASPASPPPPESSPLSFSTRSKANAGAQVGHTRGVAVVAHGKGDGVLQPVVPDAVGIVRSGREGVLFRAELAAKCERDLDGVAGGARPELQLL